MAQRVLPVPAIIGITLIIGALGGFAFSLFHLPAPWISGAMVFVVGLIGLRFKPFMPDALRDLGMLMAGLALGSAITPDMLVALQRYPLSLLILTLTTFGIVAAGRFVLMRLFRFEAGEAMFASLPGAMSAVLASAAAAKVDLVRVASMQVFRMFILVALLPSVLSTATTGIVLPVQQVVGAAGFACEAFAGLATALILQRLNVMAPYLLGGMSVAGVAHLSRFVVGTPPDLVVNLAMVLIGIFAGTRFSSVDGRAFRALALPAFVLFLVTMAVSALGALAVIATTQTPVAEAFVALAPGGLEAMVAVGIAMGLDPLYVSSHHIARFVLIAFASPIIGRMSHPKT